MESTGRPAPLRGLSGPYRGCASVQPPSKIAAASGAIIFKRRSVFDEPTDRAPVQWRAFVGGVRSVPIATMICSQVSAPSVSPSPAPWRSRRRRAAESIGDNSVPNGINFNIRSVRGQPLIDEIDQHGSQALL